MHPAVIASRSATPLRRASRSQGSENCGPEPAFVTCIHLSPSSERAQVEAFLDAAYARAFGGTLRSHYPVLMGMRDEHGMVVAAAGLRSARSSPLFLEQYIDEPIELALSRICDLQVARQQIVEIGNLAAARPSAALQLFDALASHLADGGATHVAVTATRALRRTLRRLGFCWCHLASADPARIAAADDWGRYYEADPQVIAGPIHHGLAQLQANPRLAQ